MNKFELEDLTQFFYGNYQEFLIKNFISIRKNVSIKLTIDTRTDLNNILKITK
jgi:hypothetical protein